MKVMLKLSGVGVAAIVALGGTAGIASAATQADDTGQQGQEVALRITGFDRNVAAANGYEIRTDAEGREYSVAAGTKSTAGTVSPNNSVGGNCGVSSLFWGPTSGHSADIITGFRDLIKPAVQLTWIVHVIDKYGVSDKKWSGPLDNKTSWVGTNHFTSAGAGPASATVTTGTAILNTGAVCTTGHPTASTVL